MGLDGLLRFLALGDLIGVTKAATAKGITILVHRECGMSGRNIKRLLRQNGIRVEHVFILSRPNLIRIVVNDYRKAVSVLGRAGVEEV